MADHLAQSLQLLVGVVFLAAAVGKLRRPSGLAAGVRDYGLVPGRAAGPVAVALLAAEALVGVSLLADRGTAIGLPLGAALLGVFAVAVGVTLARGRTVRCSCFGSPTEQVTLRTLARLGLLLGATAAVWGSGVDGFDPLVATATTAGAVAVVAIWLLHLPELLRRSPARA